MPGFESRRLHSFFFYGPGVGMIVNGSEIGLEGSATVSGWLSANGYDPSRSAVLLNGKVVPRGDMDSKELSDGDNMEIVSFVGGG